MTAPAGGAAPKRPVDYKFLRHQSHGVLGAGRSGRAAAAMLLDLDREVAIFDDFLTAPDEELNALASRGARLMLGVADAGALAGVKAVVTSPGVPSDHRLLLAAHRNRVPIRAELELGFLRLGGARLAAITGTNGKTTVTMIVQKLFEAAGWPTRAVGNIGLPLCEAVRADHAHLDEMVYACEVSSFQLEATEYFAPQVAVILNVTPDHLDRHRTMEAYAALKGRITENQGPGQVLVVNQDDPCCLKIATQTVARVMRFSLERHVEDGAWLDGDLLMLESPGRKPRRLMAVDELQMFGMHNVANALAAACVGEAFKIETKAMAATLSAFRAAPHRMELVETISGIQYIDDSKATNLDAMRRALESFSGGIHLIAGGRDKASPFETVAELLARRVKTVYLIGEAAEPMQKAWGAAVECVQCGTLENALEAATARATDAEIVLLSPGCASFDQFKSYAQRGEVFAAWVRARLGRE